jgi:EAL domain-containing protein (putative c-di-GMP-specific phosphodiesterase class I)
MKQVVTLDAESIEQALKNQEFTLHYQPQSDLCSGRIVRVEALARWNSNTLGDIDTGLFINILENSTNELIAMFHEWVIRTAFSQILAWREMGINTPIDLNFSTRYLQERECLSLIKNLLQEYDLPPSCFGIEVTESCSITNMAGIQFVLQNLHQMGVEIALDDFCTSYCSLDYLSELPATKIKIDRRFIHRLDGDSLQAQISTCIILESVIDMAAKLGMLIVAEGIETLKQLEQVTLLGCDAYQGYFFCPPVPYDIATSIILGEKSRKPTNFSNQQHGYQSAKSFFQLQAIAA